MGRPKGAPTVTIQLTVDEHAHLLRLMSLEGVRTASNLIRRGLANLMDEAGEDRPAGVFDDRLWGSQRKTEATGEESRRTPA